MITDLKVVPFAAARGLTRQVYEDIEESMQIAWIPDVFMALGNYPDFLAFAWQKLKPFLGKAGLEWPADTLRSAADAMVAGILVPSHADALTKQGFEEKQLLRIRETLEPFYYNNPRILVMVAALREALQGNPVGHTPTAKAASQVETSAYTTPVAIISPEDADDNVRALYHEVRIMMSAPYVDTSFQALAQWPNYLELAIDDLKRAERGSNYEQDVAQFRQLSLAALGGLPGVLRFEDTELRDRGIDEFEIEDILEAFDVFFECQPGVIFSTSYLYLALRGGSL